MKKVSLIIPTYLASNQRYLDVCLKSIANLDYPKELLETVIVASNGFQPTIPDGLIRPTIIKTYERLHYAAAINLGVRSASKDADFYFLISDDVILTRDCLKIMVANAGESQYIMGATSNCDLGTKHALFMGYSRPDGIVRLDSHQYRYENLEEHLPGLYNATSFYMEGMIRFDYLCFYAVLIPRSVWQKVGTLDETFKSGQEDVDYCKRALKLDVPCAMSLSAVIWHFGGVTADQVLTDEVRKTNKEYFKAKWKEAAP